MTKLELYFIFNNQTLIHFTLTRQNIEGIQRNATRHAVVISVFGFKIKKSLNSIRKIGSQKYNLTSSFTKETGPKISLLGM